MTTQEAVALLSEVAPPGWRVVVSFVAVESGLAQDAGVMVAELRKKGYHAFLRQTAMGFEVCVTDGPECQLNS